MSSKERQLEKKLKHCQENLKKAIDELYRIKKSNKSKKCSTNLSKDDLKKINNSINRIHKIEDKIKDTQKKDNVSKVYNMKKKAEEYNKNYNNPFRTAGKRRKSKRKSKN